MAEITLRQAALWCGGHVEEKYADITFLGACNDSRKILPGQLFLALPGARDGHDFIPVAMEKGAAAVLCTKACPDVPSIVVEDTRLALGKIARAERQRIGMKVVGVTGSVGKSTTKEMIACVLEDSFRVAKTPVNHNNDIGMPMAILSMPLDTQVAVLEMGMNHFREIAYLTDIARPDVAVIINIGTMHIEHLGSRQGILQAKLEILEGMGPDGILLLNGDDDMLMGCRDTLSVRPRYFGWREPQCHACARDVEQTEELLRFTADDGVHTVSVELALEGEHYVSDAMAAVSVGLELGVEPESICRALAKFRNMSGRQEVLQVRGCTVINDCYNAGPESMQAALLVLGAKKGRRIAVLGDMLELGPRSQAEHYKIGRLVAQTADLLFAFGPNGRRIASGAITGGMDDAKVSVFESRESLARSLIRTATEADVILFKGSRGMHLELILEQFVKEET